MPSDNTATARDNWTELLVRIAEHRDQSAFAALFRHFGPRVRSYLMKSGASPTMAEEAMQEAMAAVWHKAHLFNPTKASATTWIFTVARNKRIDAIRQQKRPEPEELPWAMSETPEQEEEVARMEESKLLAEAIGKLPERQQKLIRLAYFGEMSHSEIAADTGLPIGTIKSRIRLGLERLRYEMSTKTV
ncbi:sigma-70 family RNA polymerase sigma factor [Oceanomicrobium pacificus]|uniref:sigma-70 family RNA polymerase sigma factor n=1 Tax=Oceanomicrobium pacificus TaxID=2692916 RepID=UPI002E281919|nr:sigma-70 family RNA polymerase sigma factor [Oceanomicrobium pacificus]